MTANDWTYIADIAIALIALINPISKIFILSTLSKNDESKEEEKDLKDVAVKSSAIGMVILVAFALIGNILLQKLFHVDIYSFQIAGGLVLLYRGFQALNKGVFFEFGKNQNLKDISIVPLASPMIAGPATITACVSFSTLYGFANTIIAVVVAILFNLFIMLNSKFISGLLDRINMMGTSIRITGLIVATIGIQMCLDGIGTFIHTI